MKDFKSKAEYERASAEYLPRNISSLERETRIENGWRAWCATHNREPYPPAQAQRTPAEEEDAAAARERARWLVAAFRQVCPTCPLSTADLERGQLAGEGRDERGFKR